MDRRRFLLTSLAGAAAAPLAAEAQRDQRMPRIGVLYMNTPTPPADFESFWERLRDLGWVEGQSAVVEVRGGAQEWNRLAILANELVKLKVDVIVMDNGTAAKIVQATIAPTPICE